MASSKCEYWHCIMTTKLRSHETKLITYYTIKECIHTGYFWRGPFALKVLSTLIYVCMSVILIDYWRMQVSLRLSGLLNEHVFVHVKICVSMENHCMFSYFSCENKIQWSTLKYNNNSFNTLARVVWQITWVTMTKCPFPQHSKYPIQYFSSKLWLFLTVYIATFSSKIHS